MARKSLKERIDDSLLEMQEHQKRHDALLAQYNAQEEKARTHRLCKHGGYVEKHLLELKTLTDKQFYTYVEKVMQTPFATRILAELAAVGVIIAEATPANNTVQGGGTAVPKPAAATAQGNATPTPKPAAAAYRAAELLRSEYDGREHDYTRKRGVIHKEILLPEHAPPEYADRAVLWNAVEKSETPKNAQLAREIELSLPIELTREQNIALVCEFVQRQFVSAGMCADVCVHDAKKGNPHAHVMLTMRPIEPDGTWGAKSRKEYILDSRGERIKLPSGEFKTRKICSVDWNEHTKAEEWRAAWGDAVNAALETGSILNQTGRRLPT